MAKGGKTKSVVTITTGARWEAKKIIKEGFKEPWGFKFYFQVYRFWLHFFYLNLFGIYRFFKNFPSRIKLYFTPNI